MKSWHIQGSRGAWTGPASHCYSLHALLSALIAHRALTLNLHAQGARLYLLPAVREGHELAATFVFPSLEREYRAKAEDYVSHFVGHEGDGSLLSTLKARACGFVRSPSPLAGRKHRGADV